jgi:hypothetical protein
MRTGGVNIIPESVSVLFPKSYRRELSDLPPWLIRMQGNLGYESK